MTSRLLCLACLFLCLTAFAAPIRSDKEWAIYPQQTPADWQSLITSGNLAAGKTATTSGYTDVYPASNVTDGNQATYWESTNNAFPQWVQVDLGSTVGVSSVILKLPTGWGARTQTLTVQGGTDGTTFSTIVASASPFTLAGVNWSMVVALPICPWLLYPQHDTLPPVSTAQVCP